jgi:putative intracellular protease/amidase
LLETTKPISDVDVSAYHAVCVDGGGAPLVTFKDDMALHKLIADFYDGCVRILPVRAD